MTLQEQLNEIIEWLEKREKTCDKVNEKLTTSKYLKNVASGELAIIEHILPKLKSLSGEELRGKDEMVKLGFGALNLNGFKIDVIGNIAVQKGKG